VKFLCPACERLTAFSEFRVEGDVLFLRCSRCRVENQSRSSADIALGGDGAAAVRASPPAQRGKAALALIPTAPPPAADADMWSVPEGHCPKCVALRPPQATSCAQCGLVFSNFRPEEVEPSAAMAEHFRRLIGSWEDVEEHDRVIQAALVQGELAALGRLYRIQLARAPRDAYAARGRDEVLRLATASSGALVQSETTPVSRYRSAGLFAALFGMLLLLAISLFVIFRRYAHS
jgi:ribosomal protein L40E